MEERLGSTIAYLNMEYFIKYVLFGATADDVNK